MVVINIRKWSDDYEGVRGIGFLIFLNRTARMLLLVDRTHKWEGAWAKLASAPF